MEKTWIAKTDIRTWVAETRSPNGFTRALNLSKLIAASVKDEEVENAVWNGHKTLHITFPNGHTWCSSSRAKSKGMLRAGVTRSQKARFSINKFGFVRIPLAPSITIATKLLPMQLRVKIITYSVIFEIRNPSGFTSESMKSSVPPMLELLFAAILKPAGSDVELGQWSVLPWMFNTKETRTCFSKQTFRINRGVTFVEPKSIYIMQNTDTLNRHFKKLHAELIDRWSKSVSNDPFHNKDRLHTERHKTHFRKLKPYGFHCKICSGVRWATQYE